MQCTYQIWNFCFVPVVGSSSLFGFKDFIAALALLIIIYTMSDVRYRFRVAVAPIPLYKLTFLIVSIVGFGTLATDIWISEKYLVPDSYLTTSIWEGILAALFLGLVVTWMRYAFIQPPIYGKDNFAKFSRELYQVVLKGSDAELPVIAHELISSASSLISLASELRQRKSETINPKDNAAGYANDMLLLIANRKFCRHIVASTPSTAIRLVDAVVDSQAYDVPIGLFLQNVSAEAISNKDSMLYHEDSGYSSGLLGHIKPLSTALYGNYLLVEHLRNHSPLDINYKLVRAWDSMQFETYCRAVLMTFANYLDRSSWNQHSYVLNRAFSAVQETTGRALTEIKRTGDDYLGDSWSRLSTGVDFFRDCINLIGKMQRVPDARNLRVRATIQERFGKEDVYDQIAKAMFEIIFTASCIDGPPEKAWTVHYVSIWGDFFGLPNSGLAWKIVQFKVRRLLYDEIRRLEKFPNYKGARVLAICLNVMGLTIDRRITIDRESNSLKIAVLAWVKRNYLKLREANLDVANACLIGSITFDSEGSRFVETFAKGLNPKPVQHYLELSGKNQVEENEVMYPWKRSSEALAEMSLIDLWCYQSTLKVRKSILQNPLLYKSGDPLEIREGNTELKSLNKELTWLMHRNGENLL